MNVFDDVIKDLKKSKKELPTIVKAHALVLEDIFLANLANEIGFPEGAVSPDQARIKSSSKLVSRSGALYDSFRSDTKTWTPLTGVESINGKIRFTVGSSAPYADIQNDGGVILPTQKMIGYFWYLFIISGNDLWKGLALHGLAGKGFKIKKSAYLDKAWQKFLVEGVEEVEREVRISFVKYFDKLA